MKNNNNNNKILLLLMKINNKLKELFEKRSY